MKRIRATLAVYSSFEDLRKVGGDVDVPAGPLPEGLYLVTMYDDGSIVDPPQHVLAVVVGDNVLSKWQVVNRCSARSPVGRREIITVEFEPDAIPLYVGLTKVDAVAQQTAGLPIYEVHSLYSPTCHCVILVDVPVMESAWSGAIADS